MVLNKKEKKEKETFVFLISICHHHRRCHSH